MRAAVSSLSFLLRRPSKNKMITRNIEIAISILATSANNDPTRSVECERFGRSALSPSRPGARLRTDRRHKPQVEMPMYLCGVPFEEFVDNKKKEIQRDHPAVVDAVAYVSRILDEIGPILCFAFLCLLHCTAVNFVKSVEEEIASANRLQHSDVALSWSASLLVPFINDTLVTSSQQLQSSTPVPPLACSADKAALPFNTTGIIDALLPLVSAAASSKVRLFGFGARSWREEPQNNQTNASSLVGRIIDLGRTKKPIQGKLDIRSM